MTKFISWFYKNILKKIYFRMDPELIHNRMIKLGNFLGSYYLSRKLIRSLFFYSNPRLKQEILGIKFPNPIGLAAGFDKDARLTNILPDLGFGFAEVGSITGEPCAGNPKPRLWRLIKSKSLVVHYGLKNEGAIAIAKRLKGRKFRIPLGISIAKTNNLGTVDPKKGIADYLKAYQQFTNIGTYLTINISCPNTYDSHPFMGCSVLESLLQELNKRPKTKPVFIKLSPDLDRKIVDKIISLAGKYHIDGFICTNLTKQRDNPRIVDKNVPSRGGISGKVMAEQSNQLISDIYNRTRGKFIIIGCGGIFTAEDAYQKIKLGANLLQIITGMIYQGPQVISEINKGLVRLLEKDGFNNISEAVGKSH